MNRPVLLLLVPLLTAPLLGCGDRHPAPIRPKDFVDPSIEVFAPVATLGVEGHPATFDLWVAEETGARPLHPGGFVVRAVDDGGPAAGRLRVGDVVFRVGEHDVPNVEDPTVDLVALVESAAAEGDGEVELGVLRRGRPTTTTVELDLRSLDEGLPDLPPRLRAMADRALDALAHAQRTDGSFPAASDEPGPRLLVAATAGLAFLASGSDLEDGGRATNVRLCREAVEAAVGTVGGGTAAVPALSMAVHFLAESSGRGPDVGAPLARAVDALVSARSDDGGFPMSDPDESLGYSDRTFATHLALQAIGVAERAGATVDPEVVEAACAFLKEHTNDGQVVSRRPRGSIGGSRRGARPARPWRSGR